MESAAKKKNTLAIGVVASMIVWASALLFSSAANASSASHVGQKSRAEVSGPFTAKSIEHLAANPISATRYYDALEGVALECTVAPKGAPMGPGHNAANAAKLNQHLKYFEDYGSAGFRELENGRIRYYGGLTPASKPGTIAGRRTVHEWDPSTSTTRTWMESLDHQGRVRIVRPETGGPKVHYQFDENGNCIGTF